MAKRGQWTIPLNKIPSNIVVHQYIYENSDIKKKISLFKDYKQSDYLEIPLTYKIDDLKISVTEAIGLYGQHKFTYKDQSKVLESYVSCSLTYNPEAIDKISEDPHRATLGSTQLQFGSAAQYENIPTNRNTYHDTFSFKELTPFAQYKEIKFFLNCFQRTLIRSRVSTVLAGMDEATKVDYGWHNDEVVFMNLRVNIPIQTSSNYVIQIISEATGDELNITEFELKKGFAYAYDTNKYHRPFCKQLDTIDRINMICGVSPWFDFDVEANAWISNEFYGEMHPFEMLAKGHISSLIQSS